MYEEVQLETSGEAVIVRLPNEMLAKHDLLGADRLWLVSTEAGILVTAQDPEFSKAALLAQRGANRFRNALRRLAE